MKIRTIHLSLVLLAGIAGCIEQDIVATDDVTLNQEIYFEVTHTDQAWGRARHEGFLVDKSGTVRTFTNPTAWNEPEDNKGMLTPDLVKENIAKTVLTKVKVDVTELKAYSAKIPTLTNSSLTKRMEVGKDMGQTIYYAYQYDTKKEVYVPILLSETGDFQRQNKDKAATEIATWLTNIRAKL